MSDGEKMKDYVIAMKSGASFIVQIKDYAQFIEKLKAYARRESPVNLYVGPGVVFDINDVSAIYPVTADRFQ